MSYNTQNFKTELKKVEEWLSKELSQVQTGRATPIVLDSITIESYGSLMQLKNVASITVEDPKTLRIAPWDKTQIRGIEQAIQEANIGLSMYFPIVMECVQYSQCLQQRLALNL
jgi:ribosome recycling factor